MSASSPSTNDEDMPLQAVGGGAPAPTPAPTAAPLPTLQNDRSAAFAAMSQLESNRYSSKTYGYVGGGIGGGIGGFFGSIGNRILIRFVIGAIIVGVSGVARCIKAQNHRANTPPAVQQPSSPP